MSEPKRTTATNNTFAVVIGAFLLIEGIWGLFSDVVFGVFSTNVVHASIHIVLGISGIVLGMKQNAGAYCTLLGVLLIIVGLLYFVLGTDSFMVRLLNVNKPVAIFNCFIGVLSLSVVYYRRPGVLKN